MEKNLIIIFLSLFLTFTGLYSKEKNYLYDKNVTKFIDKLVKKHKLNKKKLEKLFSSVKLQKSSLKYYTKKRKKDFESDERRGSWDRYSKKLLSKERIELGIQFIKENEKALKKAYKKYKVPPHYITAIIGVESFYGKFKGSYPTFDTLVTLAFEKNRRNKFFKSELEEFIVLSNKNKQNPKTIKGSFAGAIGLAQFMPSSINTLAIDFNADKKIDLDEEWDAIGSIAKYLSKSGWEENIPVTVRVSYKGERFNSFKTGFKHKYKRSVLKGIKPKFKRFYYNRKVYLIKLDRKKYDELWYGTKNYYVITRYNRSSYYAMAVHFLAQEIKKAYKRQMG